MIDSHADKQGQDVANTVLAAAELNKQVILRHQQHIARVSDKLLQAEAKLATLMDSVADVREAKVLVDAIASIVAARKTLFEQERRAFGISEKDDEAKPAAVEDLLRRVWETQS